ncbi:MAG TPA: aminotransferase class III-fold pyridoxal phosphate-dependent enzyme, partial [Blastocatellia bacterium]
MVAPARIVETGKPPAAIISLLSEEFARLSGLELSSISIDASFVEMGADSLFLLRASQSIQDRFGVRIPFRMLFEEISTIEKVASYLAERLPPDSGAVHDLERAEPLAVGEKAASVEEQPSNNGDSVSPAITHAAPLQAAPQAHSGIERVIEQQLQIMSRQLELLRKAHANGYAGLAAQASSKNGVAVPSAGNGHPKSIASEIIDKAHPVQTTKAQGHQAHAEVKSHGTYESLPVEGRFRGLLSSSQREYLDGLITRVNAKTRRSKEIAGRSRKCLADNRATAGYHPLWKELQYPLLVERGRGARIWDIDGNEYVDLAVGFGALLFGHSPNFLTDALVDQVSNGMLLGAESPVAGEAAALICELTGVERVTFCNSGTEAVMTALRLARAVTGKQKIALFEGCYHGTFDQVIVRRGSASDDHRPNAGAVGVPESLLSDVILLKLDDKDSIDYLRSHADELAAVLIEPLPSRAPHMDLKGYIEELRRFTRESEVALIFDEVVTGFRFHPGGMQAIYGIQADLVTYGKAIAGGLPVGVVAGSARFMDPIDGGNWNYGDGSYPGIEMTFFAGTYFKHPLIMPAMVATLRHIKEAGPSLQESLNRQTAHLAARLNEFLSSHRMPVRVVHRASLFRFFFRQTVKFSDLFYYALLEKGVFISETRGCLLSTAHTQADLDHAIWAVRESLRELKAAGFLPEEDASETDWLGLITSSVPAKKDDKHHDNASHSDAAASQLSSLVGPEAGKSVRGASTMKTPSTANQRDLWTLARFSEDGSRAYNETTIIHFRGELLVSGLRNALQVVVNRHAALRTTFSDDGQYQVIRLNLAVEIPIVDLLAYAEGERRARYKSWLSEEVSRQFDLATGPLLRTTLVKLDHDHHALVLVLHHAITDGNSNGILLREIAALYSAAVGGLKSNLPEAPAAGQVDTADTLKKINRAEAYWIKQFFTVPPPLELPIDRQRPPVQTYSGARETFVIGGDLLNHLKSAAAHRGSTTFVTLLGAFAILLHNLSGQEDLIVGCPVGQTGGVGYNVNLLPIRSRWVGNPTQAAYFAQIRDTLLDAYEYQAYPLSNLIKTLRLRRDPGRHPMITAAFNSDRTGGTATFYGLGVDIETGPVRFSKFEIFLNVTEQNDVWRFDFDYNTDLFDQSTITRWAGHLKSLLQSITSNTDRLSDLNVLTPQERTALLFGSKERSGKPRIDCCVHEEFVHCARVQPDSIAVSCENGHLTYRGLDVRSAKLANRLQRMGAGIDLPVGLCMERTPEMIIGLIGTMRSGAAYVPLDPVYPGERLEFIASDSGMRILVTERSLEGRVRSSDVRTVFVGPDENVDDETRDDPVWRVPLDAAAYVIYTSGSTGTPKGVVVTHRNLARLFAATRADFGFSDSDIWSLFHSYAFDFSVWEIWGALAHGGRLVVVPYWLSRSHEGFVDLVAAEGVTILNQTPSAFSQFLSVETQRDRRNLALRLIIFGGEALAPSTLGPWFERYSDQSPRLVNMYGITETTVHVTLLILDVHNTGGRDKSPIGRALSDLS